MFNKSFSMVAAIGAGVAMSMAPQVSSAQSEFGGDAHFSDAPNVMTRVRTDGYFINAHAAGTVIVATSTFTFSGNWAHLQFSTENSGRIQVVGSSTGWCYPRNAARCLVSLNATFSLEADGKRKAKLEIRRLDNNLVMHKTGAFSAEPTAVDLISGKMLFK